MYTADEMLKMCHHPFDSQKNESLNHKIATVAPKTKMFCGTLSLSDQIASSSYSILLDTLLDSTALLQRSLAGNHTNYRQHFRPGYRSKIRSLPGKKRSGAALLMIRRLERGD